MFDALILDLAHKRAAAKEAAEAYDKVFSDFLIEIQTIAQRKNLTEGAAKEADRLVRQAALGNYLETGDQTPHPAIRVQLRRAARYNHNDAQEWCREHRPELCKLDTYRFEQEVLSGDGIPPEIATVEDKPQIVMQSLLGEYIIHDEAQRE